MPIPTPQMGKNPEDRNSFIKRCAADSVMNKEFPDNRQKIAVCFSSWKKAHPKDKETKAEFDYYLDQSQSSLEIIDLNKLSQENIDCIERNLENKENID